MSTNQVSRPSIWIYSFQDVCCALQEGGELNPVFATKEVRVDTITRRNFEAQVEFLTSPDQVEEREKLGYTMMVSRRIDRSNYSQIRLSLAGAFKDPDRVISLTLYCEEP